MLKRLIYGLLVSSLLAAILVACVDSETTEAAAETLERQAAESAQLAGELEDAVTNENVLEHLEAFQAIADANGGNRYAGLPGYERSAEYVYNLLEAAGYDVSYQEFTYRSSAPARMPEFVQAAPSQQAYVLERDFFPQTFSGSGDVVASVTAVDLDLGLGNSSTSGCEAADFAGFPNGDIALIQRGGCSFAVKAETAQAAGAVGVVIFNQGDADSAARQGVFGGTLGENTSTTIPVVNTSYALGADFSELTGSGLELQVSVSANDGTLTTRNVIAETTTGNADNVVMVGAHLDSVIAGPGIQDNGSGSAAILEVALQLAEVFNAKSADSTLDNKVRFAWWSAEESGLIGSDFYVNDLARNDRAALEDISLYLNFDMIASPNYYRGIYDGDQSDFRASAPVPEGSAQIERVFETFYENEDLAYQGTAYSGRSDYRAFINNGIPAGGLFTGAEQRKTQEEAQIYGGVAGQPYDLCYHRACDDIDNLNLNALSQNSDAVAYAVTTFAANNTGLLSASYENEDLALSATAEDTSINVHHDAFDITE